MRTLIIVVITKVLQDMCHVCKVFCKVIESSAMRSNQNDFDCGVYCIKAMEWYDGGNEKKHPITTLLTAYTKNLTRCHLTIDLKKRKDKEKHLANLRAKRVEKVFLEDEKIKKERARHEQEVDDFLNNDLDDSPKLKKLFQFDYNQVSKPE
ncbi:RTX-III toxin determinant A from serotype 8 [Bienertia sinuspersici]